MFTVRICWRKLGLSFHALKLYGHTTAFIRICPSSTEHEEPEDEKQLKVQKSAEEWKKYRHHFRHGHSAWRPQKRLTRYEMDHLRTLKQEDPDTWTLGKLSEAFGISVPSVVRILRSKFEPLSEVKQRQDARVSKEREKRRQNVKKILHTEKETS